MYSDCYIFLLLCILIVVLCILCLRILIVTYVTIYIHMLQTHVCSVLDIVFHCVVLCIVCVKLCTVLLPPGVNQIAVNKYIISYHKTIQVLFLIKTTVLRFWLIL